MAKLLFRMRNVPDDEAAEVRELLDTHNISYYETSAGNWGISMPGLWLNHDDDYPQARALLDEYQSERAQRMRASYEADRAAGEAETMLDLLRREPAKVLGYLILIAAIIYISLTLFY